jgi:hypothetical protein
VFVKKYLDSGARKICPYIVVNDFIPSKTNEKCDACLKVISNASVMSE